MVDFVKFELSKSNYEQILLAIDLLEFDYSCDGTGVVLKRTAVYPKGSGKKALLTFVITQTKITVSGSLHKFHNGCNYTDFTYEELLLTLENMRTIFSINPKDAILHVVEFGVNLKLENVLANDFVDNCLLYKTMPFDLENFRRKGKMKMWEFSQYEIKLYDKSWQCSLTEDNLRFEFKYKKMEGLGRNLTLCNLVKIETITKLSERLLGVAKELLVLEPSINQAKLTKPNKRLYSNWEKQNYAVNLAINDPEKFKYEREKFRKITSKHSKQKIHQVFVSTIAGRLIDFQNDAKKYYPELTDF